LQGVLAIFGRAASPSLLLIQVLYRVIQKFQHYQQLLHFRAVF
jgi:hypothetical protein